MEFEQEQPEPVPAEADPPPATSAPAIKACGLCLCKNSSITPVGPEDDAMRQKVDKIFYFQIVRGRGAEGLICETCRETVDGFYEYAEQVLRNQQFLRSTMVASGSGLSTDGGATIKQEFIKHEPDETEWVGVDTYCETRIQGDQDWVLDDGEEVEDGEGDVTDSMSDGEGEEGTEFVQDVKPKRKYTKRKNRLMAKKPKIIKKEQDLDNPPIDKLVLQHYKLSCDVCAEPLEDFTELRKHYKYVHNEPGYLKCCNKKIYKKCWMIEHIQLHLNPDAFHCALCNKSYSSSKVLKEHTKEVHAPEENRHFKCETCFKPFVSNAHLNAHIMVAHGSVPCPQCPKVLASQGSLKKHLVAMHGEGEQHVCDVCARVFRSKQCFETHVQGHLGTRLDNKVQCSVCSVWLTDKYCLTKHMRRMHVEEIALSCELCGKQVRNQDALNCHVRRAHTESRYECDMCKKKFKRPHHMREHIAIHHTGEDIYSCNHCTERFNTKNKQYLHRKTAHPVEYEAEMRKRMMKDA
ncbi:transcription factor grauzone [Culex quinquefasciatus]|uniref:Transcription factor grauzone n=1 Tax=Culex quinquefasciatus TaxID=7176 RepID=B0WFL9_CULQU|nr:transcription factor grauzone [Culex quinquefasciatus]|eukprot:XP_001847503.1 transcription factor grauzone [Culex quinquefasciatus]